MFLFAFGLHFGVFAAVRCCVTYRRLCSESLVGECVESLWRVVGRRGAFARRCFRELGRMFEGHFF